MNKTGGPHLRELRKRAEKILRQRCGDGSETCDADLIHLIHELEVNQVELELQNEELQRSRKELEDSRSQYYSLYDSAPVGYVTLNRKKLAARVNRAAEEMLAVSGEALKGKGFSERVHSKDRRLYYACLRKVAESGSRHDCEVRLSGKGGSYLFVRIEAGASFDPAGKPTEWRLAISDISKQKKIEEALRSAHDLLEQKIRDRTEELVNNYEMLRQANAQLQLRTSQLRKLTSQLTMAEQRERKRLSKILHDGLQQNLATAKLRIGYFADKLREPDRKREAYDIEAILGESMQMSRSLSLELSPPVLQEGCLTDGLEWLVRWMRDKHNFNVELSMESQPKLPEDVTILVFESVRELLFNAVKHARVSWARVNLRQHGNSEIRIVVSDEGAGFDPSRLNSLEPSDRGLGLFSIQERVDSIGGRFEIDSAPGKGCRFTLNVPTAAEAAAPVAEPSASAGSGADGQKEISIRVLLADDHALFRDGIGRILSQEPDIEVVGYARDGREAIELARKLMPNMILMDIGMPKVDGIEATRVISRESATVRIIGLSMYEDQERSRAMLAAGAVDYKSKGCAPAELISAIRDCMK